MGHLSLLQLLGSVVTWKQKDQFVNKWTWVSADKTLFTKKAEDSIQHQPGFASSWSRLEKIKQQLEVGTPLGEELPQAWLTLLGLGEGVHTGHGTPRGLHSLP